MSKSLRLIELMIKDLEPGEEMYLLWMLQDYYGWAGAMFMRNDAEQEWHDQQYGVTTGLTPNDPLPDDVWEAIQDTWEWRKGITEIFVERGWDLVSTAVKEATQHMENH